ncbi:ER membrane protein complex subunit 6 [Mycena kentingensis (nom. inval.)]|nr:ER membrane protein complex subunit 6 [Mycena kentingensis (nom. inval.)]
MSTPDASVAQQRIFAPNAQFNSTVLSVKFISACFAGAVAGILGLQNIAGFALFLASTLFTTLCIYLINCKGRPAKYIPSGWTGLVNPGQDNAFTFILVWTLFFGIVHVYD